MLIEIGTMLVKLGHSLVGFGHNFSPDLTNAVQIWSMSVRISGTPATFGRSRPNVC